MRHLHFPGLRALSVRLQDLRSPAVPAAFFGRPAWDAPALFPESGPVSRWPGPRELGAWGSGLPGSVLSFDLPASLRPSQVVWSPRMAAPRVRRLDQPGPGAQRDAPVVWPAPRWATWRALELFLRVRRVVTAERVLVFGAPSAPDFASARIPRPLVRLPGEWHWNVCADWPGSADWPVVRAESDVAAAWNAGAQDWFGRALRATDLTGPVLQPLPVPPRLSRAEARRPGPFSLWQADRWRLEAWRLG